MCAWYVFSAMGFYPVCPGKPVYDMGSPIFDEVKLHLGNGSTFTIRAENNSPKAKYIQRAELNGQPMGSPFLRHADLMAGGTLTLWMGERPERMNGIGE